MLLTLGSFLTVALATAFVVVCLFMMLVILIQKPKGGGLGSAFGGGGGGGSETAAFGAKTGDVLTWVTVTCFVLFLLLAMGLTWTIRAEVNPATTPSATQTTTTTGTTGGTPGTTGTPGSPGQAPTDTEQLAEEADAQDTVEVPGSGAPVTGQPPAAGDAPGEAAIERVLPPDAPEQPATQEEVEQAIEELGSEDEAGQDQPE